MNIKDTQLFFSNLGTITIKSMFGTFGIFCDGVIFALHYKNRIYFRSSPDFGANPISKNRYCYRKRGHLVKTNYFISEYERDEKQLLEHAERSINAAKRQREYADKAPIERLKDLPNISVSTERMLLSINIESVHQLANRGSVNSYKKLKDRFPKISKELVLHLEGAIQNCHWAVIPKDRRDFLNSMITRSD
ncbi:TfoX/Sxy family DNA transformation protein [Vibrio coralliilyticus]|uniref:TfoX/Sxy family DNA transformation protein n=1 Tax=Vibrio coralliilyticus TaxID=190893 RepID=UPI0015605CBF|nr:TfoX/Sxy family DNA transformation protein [Vibrio coralliilyticus]NRF64022.1 TfoX/Sxy family DNA transformation protein [Vibrio coralliilyticus]